MQEGHNVKICLRDGKYLDLVLDDNEVDKLNYHLNNRSRLCTLRTVDETTFVVLLAHVQYVVFPKDTI